MKRISHNELLSVLKYNPRSGHFRWKSCAALWVRTGTIAGKTNKNGYRAIKIAQVWYYEHRLAWFYMTGRWPRKQVDHVNRRKADNRWMNLRQADAVQNAQNSTKRSNNKTGYKWVVRRRNRYFSQVKLGSKYRFLGPFDTAKEAHVAAANLAKLKHGKFFRG